MKNTYYTSAPAPVSSASYSHSAQGANHTMYHSADGAAAYMMYQSHSRRTQDRWNGVQLLCTGDFTTITPSRELLLNTGFDLLAQDGFQWSTNGGRRIGASTSANSCHALQHDGARSGKYFCYIILVLQKNITFCISFKLCEF